MQHLPAHVERPIDERDERDEAFAREHRLERERLAVAHGEIGQAHRHLGPRGQLALGALGRVDEARERTRSSGNAAPVRSSHSDELVDDPAVEVHPAEERVAAGGDDLVDVVASSSTEASNVPPPRS